MNDPVVVLVHGAFHGGWCFDPVVAGLERVGVRAIAVDLPSHRDDGGPRADLHGDAAHVRDVLDEIAAPIVLVGHSYGGAVVTEAGVHPDVVCVVYLAGLAPSDDESCRQVLALDVESIPADMVVSPDPDTAVRQFFHDCDEQTVAWALARLRPQPLTWLHQGPTAVAWRARPSTYVVCTDDRAVPPDLQRALAQRCTASIEWDSSHSPFLSHPEWVVELLAETVTASREARRRRSRSRPGR